MPPAACTSGSILMHDYGLVAFALEQHHVGPGIAGRLHYQRAVRGGNKLGLRENSAQDTQ